MTSKVESPYTRALLVSLNSAQLPLTPTPHPIFTDCT